MLIALGETYLDAAHKNGPQLATGTDEDKEAYYALVAAGLRALETALMVYICCSGCWKTRR